MRISCVASLSGVRGLGSGAARWDEPPPWGSAPALRSQGLDWTERQDTQLVFRALETWSMSGKTHTSGLRRRESENGSCR